jgi:putative ABC transport system permease protein
LLRPLDLAQPERVVEITEQRPGGFWVRVAAANYVDWAERNRVFQVMAACDAKNAVLTGGPEPVDVAGVVVSRDYFAVLGVQPLIGRTFTDDEDRAAGPDVVVLSHGLWVSRFGAGTSLLGRALSLDGRPTTVVGVMPPHFAVCGRGRIPPLLWRPNAFANRPPDDRRSHGLSVIARLAPGISLERARAEMDAIARSLEQEYPRTNEGFGVIVTPLPTSWPCGRHSARAGCAWPGSSWPKPGCSP